VSPIPNKSHSALPLFSIFKRFGKDHAGVLEFPSFTNKVSIRKQGFNRHLLSPWVFVEREKSSIFGLNRHPQNSSKKAPLTLFFLKVYRFCKLNSSILSPNRFSHS
jgi:hypothetical protein